MNVLQVPSNQATAKTEPAQDVKPVISVVNSSNNQSLNSPINVVVNNEVRTDHHEIKKGNAILANNIYCGILSEYIFCKALLYSHFSESSSYEPDRNRDSGKVKVIDLRDDSS